MGRVEAEDARLAAVEVDEPGQRADGGGLAGAVGADQAVELAAGHLEAEPVERGDGAEAAPEPARQQRRSASRGGDHLAHGYRPVPGMVTCTGIPARSRRSGLCTATSTG